MTTIDYIPTTLYSFESMQRLGKVLYKTPIEKISIDKKRLAFANPIYEETIDSMMNNFCIESWTPIFVDDEFCIRDGQHRYTAAKLMGLKYMDVLMYHYEVLSHEKYRSNYYKSLAKKFPRKLTETEKFEQKREQWEKRMRKKYKDVDIIL